MEKKYKITHLGRHNLAENFPITPNLKLQTQKKIKQKTIKYPLKMGPIEGGGRRRRWLTTAAAVSSQLVSMPRTTKSAWDRRSSSGVRGAEAIEVDGHAEEKALNEGVVGLE